MILYNVTVCVEEAVSEQWVEWMKEIHIPEMMDTGCFEEHKFLLLTNEIDGNSGITYGIQFWSKTQEHLDKYLSDFADELRLKHQKKFINKFIAFRTVLKEV